jgi:hypothetical protein
MKVFASRVIEFNRQVRFRCEFPDIFNQIA